MAQNFIQKGKVMNWVNVSGSAVASGAIVKAGTLIGVALVTIADGATGSVALTGAWQAAKATGAAWVQGDNLYWDATNSVFTKTASGNTFAGNAFEPAASGDAAGIIRLGT